MWSHVGSRSKLFKERLRKIFMSVVIMASKGYIIVLFVILNLLQNGSASTEQTREDSALNFTQLAGKYGYYTEQHTFTTEDGYILTIFRMKGKNCQTTRLPLILMHGVIMTSDVFLDAGPDAGLAYLLADDCQDLWVGNIRGNYYTRAHVSLNPERDPEFWNFSVDQMGYYDAPATVDYILKQTGAAQVNYIGFSQGAGCFLIMCAERPEYRDKVNLFIALAPAARIEHTKSEVFRIWATACWKFYGAISKSGKNEIAGTDLRDILFTFCTLDDAASEICRTLLYVLDSTHLGSISEYTINTLFAHFPAGTSLQTLARYGQALYNDYFRKWDPNADGLIGVVDSPIYNMSTVTVPTAILYGENDGLVDPIDVKWLAERLPRLIECTPVPDPLWTHLDNVYSKYIPKTLYPKVKEILSTNG